MTNKILHGYNVIVLTSLLFSCSKKNEALTPEFTQPLKVNIRGYSGNIMEPFLSRDGTILLFNNLNATPENTNLHWATKINDTAFLYKGEIEGVNTPFLEGVPSMDLTNHLYFVSLRSYSTTLSTIYQGSFSEGKASNIEITNGVSKLQPGLLNFDVEVSADGQTIYYAEGEFTGSTIPLTADLVIAQKTSLGFAPLLNSSTILKNINTTALEYAASISTDQLEIYFTRIANASSSPMFSEIFRSTRENINEPFGMPERIKTITGLAEGPAIAPDQKTLYYHKKDNDLYVLYLVKMK